MLANYIHDIDPVIFSITESIKLRWYGLAYLLAFVIGFFLLKRLGDKKLWVLPGSMASDFIAAAAFFGVFIGGRLGHMLWYEPLEWIWKDPLQVFRVWEGGMASHGGILGLMIFTFVYCKKHKVSWTGLGDGLCVVAPIGLMLGRTANFINGELWGKVTDVSWAVKFPAALWDKLSPEEYANHNVVARKLLEADPSLREGISAEYGGMNRTYFLEKFRENPELKEIAGQYLEARHPSQLYEAFFEGFLLFLILYIVRVMFPRLKHGILTGLFFIIYALGRIFCEFFKQPELTSNDFGMTRGQFLSCFMLVFGVAFILWGMKYGGNAPDDRLEFDKRQLDKETK